MRTTNALDDDDDEFLISIIRILAVLEYLLKLYIIYIYIIYIFIQAFNVLSTIVLKLRLE